MSPEREDEQSENPRQMSLEDAHPQGYRGVWRSESLEELGEFITVDPEKDIARMHNPRKRDKIHKKDIDRMWREQLKAWGYTQANRRKRDELRMTQARKRLQETGVWHMISGGLTPEVIEKIHEILADFRPPVRDLDSSEGITIYPSEAAWRRDIHGEFDE